MDPEIISLILRSRPVVLELLRDRGFDTTSYEDQSPEAVKALAVASMNQPGAEALRIRVKRQTETSSAWENCEVVYLTFERIKPTIQKKKLENYISDTTNTQYVFVLGEPYHEVFHQVALQAWQKKVHMSLFHIKHLIVNPTKHELIARRLPSGEIVSSHEKVPAEEVASLLKELHARSKAALPTIRYHVDMQVRWLGMVPGDVVKITRNSPTSGEYVIYRLCTP